MKARRQPIQLEHPCPRYARAARVLGKRWTPLVIRALMKGPRRFSEIRDYIGNISDRLLSQRLKELEAEDIVRKKVVSVTPLLVHYELTRKGRELQEVVEAIQRWADKWVELT
jgi:DNA-binding HxlR family transcriptional regulator